MRVRAWALLGLLLLLAGCGGGGSNGGSSVAATVNGHDIQMAEYRAEFNQQLLQYIDQSGFNPCKIASLNSVCLQIKQTSLNNVIGWEIERQYAGRKGITVTKQEDDQAFAQVYQNQFHDQKAVENAFLKREEISEADLRTSLHYDLLAKKLTYDVTGKVPGSAPAIRLGVLYLGTRKEFSTAQKLIRDHQTFPSLVLYFTRSSTSPQGCYKLKCGDVGWVPLWFVPPDKAALKKIPAGGFLGPIQGQQGWVLYSVEARAGEFPLTVKQLYARRQQLFQSWLQKQIARAQVKRYVAV